MEYVPQGAVLSVLLFALRINGISKVMPVPMQPNFIFSLYVDNLQIGYSHPDLLTKLQGALNRLDNWTKNNGFKCTNVKTQVVHFSKFEACVTPQNCSSKASN